MFDLTGKTALITGSTGGIGAAIVRTLHTQGANVILTGRDADKIESLKTELGERAYAFIGDLADSEVPARMIQECEEMVGAGIDILINNAGLTRDNLAMRMKDEDWDMVINVNLSATFRLSRAVLKGMAKRRAGRIINITSIVGTMGNPGQTNYAASKGGLTAMSKSLAQEMASRGITVNCIAPGFIVSPMTDKLNEDQMKSLLTKIPLGYFGEGKDVAAATLFLASEESRYITGQTLHVNGGMAMV